MLATMFVNGVVAVTLSMCVTFYRDHKIRQNHGGTLRFSYVFSGLEMPPDIYYRVLCCSKPTAEERRRTQKFKRECFRPFKLCDVMYATLKLGIVRRTSRKPKSVTEELLRKVNLLIALLNSIESNHTMESLQKQVSL